MENLFFEIHTKLDMPMDSKYTFLDFKNSIIYITYHMIYTFNIEFMFMKTVSTIFVTKRVTTTP